MATVAARSESETRPSPPSPDRADFIDRLQDALASSPTVSAGRVHLIGLEKIKSMLGSDWERLKDKAHRIVRTILEERLSPRDVFTLYEDLSYLVVFADLKCDAAHLKCSLIAREICVRLLGSGAAARLIDVGALAAKEDGKIHFKDVPSIDVLAGRLAEVSAPVVVEDGPEAMSLADVRVIFRPLWLAQGEVISTFLGIPVAERKYGVYENSYDVLYDPQDARAIFELDAHVLRCVARELRRLASERKNALVSAPVHFQTMACVKRRVAYIELCGRLVGDHCDHMLYELMELPEGVPQARIVELVSALRPYGRAVMAKFDLDHDNFDAYRAAGLHAVGADIYSERGDEAELMARMDRFAELASRNRLKTYIHGVRTSSVMTAAIASGFNYIDGYALTSVADEPVGVYSLALEDSYRNLA